MTVAALLIWASASAASECTALLDRSFRPLAEKEPVSLCERHGGQVLLVVNTASECGYTPQYAGLEALHAEYAARGFAVIGFPANDFGGQEPGSEEQIREFCTLNYGVEFPMYEKLAVSEGQADPFYVALAEATGSYPRWNFHKYLVGRDGKPIAAFASGVKPDAAELRQAIDAALAAPAP